MPRNDLPVLIPAHDDRWIVDAVHRLGHEFGGVLGQADIAQVVSWSHADLQGPHPAAMPELVERLARQRLLQRLSVAKMSVGRVPVG